MVERASALEGYNAPRKFGLVGAGGPGIRLSERSVRSVWLISAWPDRLAEAGAAAAEATGVAKAPGPGESVTGKGGTLMRTEALKWLLVSEAEMPRLAMDEADGTVLDLGHARTVIHVVGPRAADLMARMVPLDLRRAKFPEGSVASTVLHHLGVTILARADGYDIFVLRSFGLAVWEHLVDAAAQFGVEVA